VEGSPQASDDLTPDPVFEAWERLFRRFNRTHIQQNMIRSQDFRLRDGVSVNREKYSVSTDVLHPNCCDGQSLPGWGVYSVKVSDVMGLLKIENAEDYGLCLMHLPKPKCRAHSDIRVRVMSSGLESSATKPVREYFRIQLSRLMTIDLEAGA
jgi:hypothetical protein